MREAPLMMSGLMLCGWVCGMHDKVETQWSSQGISQPQTAKTAIGKIGCFLAA
jgi:hypothetical protein